MTKKEYIDAIMSSFDKAAQKMPSTSIEDLMVPKVSFTKSSLRMLITMVLNDKHVIWKE